MKLPVTRYFKFQVQSPTVFGIGGGKEEEEWRVGSEIPSSKDRQIFFYHHKKYSCAGSMRIFSEGEINYKLYTDT